MSSATYHCPICESVLITEGSPAHCTCDLIAEQPHRHDRDRYCAACEITWNIDEIPKWAKFLDHDYGTGVDDHRD